MSVQIEQLTAKRLPAVRQLRQQSYPDNWSDEYSEQFFQWRYLPREEADTLVAIDGDRCVAMLDSWVHSYRNVDGIVRVREPCDWMCLPEYRHTGLGLQLMNEFMREPEPLLAVGGSAMTQSILPALGWQGLPGAANYILYLTSGAYTERFLRKLKLGESLISLGHKYSVSAWRGQPNLEPPNNEISERQPGGVVDGVEPSADYALACMCSEWEPGWLDNAPAGMGEFIWLVGYLDGQPCGLTVSRVYREGDVLVASFQHLQVYERSPVLYQWLIREACERLADRGVVRVVCRASCSTFGSALKDVGFVERSSSPAFWWDRDRSALDGQIHLTYWRGDDAIMPYPH